MGGDIIFDLGILNGLVYLEGNFIESNLYIKDGIIDTITTSILTCKEEYDAKGKMVLPYTMTPPLRSEEERMKMVKNIDAIDVIGTDHCPFSRKLKNKKYTSEIPMGIDGVKYSFLKMFNIFGESIISKFTI